MNELKNLIHNLVDKSENKYLLEAVLNLFSLSDEEPGDKLWQNLTDQQRKLILKAFEHSESGNELLDHSKVLTQIKNEI
ncbi:MAG: hypothetical protein IPM56_03245 [Ignavibacteriales bacterium]|nr:MAG: hypothetical protein IPM56_03245 [Ignavibacteriales bacterium]